MILDVFALVSPVFWLLILSKTIQFPMIMLSEWKNYFKPDEWLVGTIGLLAMLLAPWLLGGRLPVAPSMLGALGWFMFLYALIGLRIYRRFSYRSMVVLVCWGLLMLLMLISIINATHTPYLGADGVERLLYNGPLVSWLPTSVYSLRTFEHALMLSGCLLAAFSMFHVFTQRRAILWGCRLVSANTLILALAGIYFDATGAELIFGRFEAANASFFSSFHYHNHWGIYALCGLACGVAVWEMGANRMRGGARELNRHTVYAVSVLIILLSILTGAGRLCLIALGGFVLVSGLRFIRRYVSKRSQRLVVYLVLIFFACAGAWLARENLTDRVGQSMTQARELQQGALQDTRFYAAPRDTIRMAMDQPIWGWGAGSFLYVFRDYAGKEFYVMHHGQRVLSWMEAAHNDWLQMWAELGLAGLLLLSLPAVGWLYYICRYGQWNALSFNCGLLLLLVAAVAMLDFPMANPAIALNVWCLAALAGKYALVEKERLSV